MRLTKEECLNGALVFTLEIPPIDLVRVRLDNLDRAVLATPQKGIADVLQDLQLIAFRLEQSQGGE